MRVGTYPTRDFATLGILLLPEILIGPFSFVGGKVRRGFGGAGHFCRPLRVATQIGPYLPARSDSGSGVWSLRILQKTALSPRRIPPLSWKPSSSMPRGLAFEVFPADCPHRSHCHYPRMMLGISSAGYSGFPAYSQILQRP